MLDPQICQKARLSRDPRFDGKFFTAVKTTVDLLPHYLSGLSAERTKRGLFCLCD